MKTTLNLNDQVLRQARDRAAREGITLTRFVEDALRDGKAPSRMPLKSVKGDRSPNLDICDRDALYDVIASDRDVLMMHIESRRHRRDSET